MLFFNNIGICQTKSYLAFFGHKYYIDENNFSTENIYYTIPIKKGIKYHFCGKNILQKKTERYTSESSPLFSLTDGNDTKYYLDSGKYYYLQSFISHNYYKFTDCIDFFSVIDSISINDLKKANEFSIIYEGKENTVLGFKIIGDSLDYEIEYNVYPLNKKYSINNANEYLIKILNGINNCSKFIIKDIYFYNKREKINYYLFLEILLTK